MSTVFPAVFSNPWVCHCSEPLFDVSLLLRVGTYALSNSNQSCQSGAICIPGPTDRARLSEGFSAASCCLPIRSSSHSCMAIFQASSVRKVSQFSCFQWISCPTPPKKSPDLPHLPTSTLPLLCILFRFRTMARCYPRRRPNATQPGYD